MRLIIQLFATFVFLAVLPPALAKTPPQLFETASNKSMQSKVANSRLRQMQWRDGERESGSQVTLNLSVTDKLEVGDTFVVPSGQQLLTFTITRINEPREGGRHLVAASKDDYFHLTRYNDVTVATLSINGKEKNLRAEGRTAVIIDSKEATANYQNDTVSYNAVKPLPSVSKQQEAGTQTSTETAEVDLLIGYEASLVTDSSQNMVFGQLLHMVNNANDIYSNSNVNIELVPVSLSAVNINSDNWSAGELVSALANRADSPDVLRNVLAPLRDYRQSIGADYLTLAVNGLANGYENICGKAVQSGYNAPAHLQVSVVDFYCGGRTLAHELGHNMGLVHDRNEVPEGGTHYRYGAGYAEQGAFYTVMHYDPSSANETRVMNFSSPQLNCEGLACGIADSTGTASSSADAARALNNDRARFASIMTRNQTPNAIIVVNVDSEYLTGGTVSIEAENGELSAVCDRNNACNVQLEPGTELILSAQTDNSTEFAGWQGACESQGAECQLTAEGFLNITANFNAINTNVDLAQALDNNELNWTTGGAGEWQGQTREYTTDGDAVQSPRLEPGADTQLITFVEGPARITFDWKGDIGGRPNEARVLRDNTLITYENADFDWQSDEIEVPSGVHEIRWEFYNFSSSYDGTPESAHHIYVDNVQIEDSIGPAYPIIVTPSDGGRVVSEPEGLDCTAAQAPCEFRRELHRSARLIARPVPGWQVAAWQGPCQEERTDTAICTVSSYTRDGVEVSVEFERSDNAPGEHLRETLESDNDFFLFHEGGTWEQVEGSTYLGGTALKTPDLDDGEAAIMSTSFQGPGTLSFARKVSSEERYDVFSVDVEGGNYSYGPGLLGLDLSGEKDWTVHTFELRDNSSYTFTWTYRKDGSDSQGEDAAWLDGLLFESMVVERILTIENLGEGRVYTGNGEIDCGDDCEWDFSGTHSDDLPIRTPLIAEPAEGYQFVHWSYGANSGQRIDDGFGVVNTATEGAIFHSTQPTSLPEAADNDNLAFENTIDDKHWQGFINNHGVGGDSIRSPILRDGRAAVLKTTVIGPGTFSFSWFKRGQDPNFRVSVNGEEKFYRSTNDDHPKEPWYREIRVGEGEQEITFYADYPGSRWHTTVWLDDIQFEPDFSPRNTLVVNVEGEGRVLMPNNELCYDRCVINAAPGEFISLGSEPEGERFGSWSGACTNVTQLCNVEMDTSKVVTAHFGREHHLVDVVVTGEGSVTPTSRLVEDMGFTTFELWPAPDSEMVSASGCDGAISDGVYETGPVLEDCTVEINYGPKQYTVSTSVSTYPDGDPADAVVITPTEQQLTIGESTTLTVEPQHGYRIPMVNGGPGGCGGSLDGNVFTTGKVYQNCTVHVGLQKVQWWVGSEEVTGGGVNEGGKVYHEGYVNVSIHTWDGYEFESISGCPGELDGMTFKAGPIVEDCSLMPVFSKVDGITVSTETSEGGRLTPAQISVDEGDSVTLYIEPEEHYRLDTIDGCNGNLISDRYEINSVTEACTVTAEFTYRAYYVQVESNDGGFLSPESVWADYNSRQVFDVIPDEGYQLAGVSGCGGELVGDEYIVDPVPDGCVIAATFELSTETVTITPEVYPAEGGELLCETFEPVINTPVECEAELNPGYRVENWTGACLEGNRKGRFCTVRSHEDFTLMLMLTDKPLPANGGFILKLLGVLGQEEEKR